MVLLDQAGDAWVEWMAAGEPHEVPRRRATTVQTVHPLAASWGVAGARGRDLSVKLR